MTARPESKRETHFRAPGSLARPRAIGRLVRLLLGLWLLWFLYSLLRFGSVLLISTTAPKHWSWWLATLVGLWVFPDVVNIGWGKNWKHRPRVAVLGVAGLLVVVDLLAYGAWWAPPLGVFVFAWHLYWSAHLGLSFALASIIATPGCEMRALPHLWTRITGHTTHEHYCPSFVDGLDRWERRRAGPSGASA
jgi:hypothetical protein